QEATRFAIEVPLQVMKRSLDAFEVIEAMVEKGNPNSISDAGVGALCARTAVYGAHMNVLINLKGFKDKAYADAVSAEAREIADKADNYERRIRQRIQQEIEK
ncbi:cyclodeaminase/cyclohydrolase family protein, partial [Arthrospira platensis SPKY1]|nr:cyclodeaminase/cyclohydrolase family protein [Arthrospira platensis SPKY1]